MQPLQGAHGDGKTPFGPWLYGPSGRTVPSIEVPDHKLPVAYGLEPDYLLRFSITVPTESPRRLTGLSSRVATTN